MDPARTVRLLISLTQFEIDVIKAYEQALQHIQEPAVRDEMYRMKADNERHVLEWSGIIRELGSEPPGYARDLKGYLMACVTAMRSAAGSDGALRAVQAIGSAIAERYAQAMAGDVSMEILARLQSGHADVIRHLDVLAGESAAR